MEKTREIVSLRAERPLDITDFGARAWRLSEMFCKGYNVPEGIVLSTALIKSIASDGIEAFRPMLSEKLEPLLGTGKLVVRGSAQDSKWGGPAVVTDVLGFSSVLDVVSSMVDVWNRPSALMLRQVAGAPEDAGLGLIIHQMIEGKVAKYQSVDTVSGADRKPEFPADIQACLLHAAQVLRDAPSVEVIRNDTGFHLIGLFPVERKARADVQVVVDLVEQGVLSQSDALLRVNPRSLTEHLHPQIVQNGDAEIITQGIGGSPGAAKGRLVFNATDAQAAEAQGLKAILVRTETSPEDIRGMYSAAGVLTLSGGTSSHAAVIAQGIGVPCVVGASDLKIDQDRRSLFLPDGSALGEDDEITLDGANGRVFRGGLKLSQQPLSEAFTTLMGWADETRTIGVRANADTLQEAKTAQRFQVDGIGLCRTEHMFYEGDGINLMREVILAEDNSQRIAALDQLLPLQRNSFTELFETMQGTPVTIRLLDPPLHEFLPSRDDEIEKLAKAMKMEVWRLKARIWELQEYNPMLGMRGVRLAVVMPEIYEMQARAIFEAAQAAAKQIGRPVVPEIMVPLVSAHKEVELVKSRLEAVAEVVGKETGTAPSFHLGVMVETPRAALRAGDLAEITSFLSFGTNDLTQMTYGLSRDDAGHFMREYVNGSVYPEDPFLTLDLEGVGELVLIAAKRGRGCNPDIQLGLCGEHGGDPASVQFCDLAGFDYVSCSPFRVPIARLAAAQASLLSNKGADVNRSGLAQPFLTDS